MGRKERHLRAEEYKSKLGASWHIILRLFYMMIMIVMKMKYKPTAIN